MTRSATCVTVLWLVLLCACSKREGQDYWPISDGASWEYRIDYTTPLTPGSSAKLLTRVEGTETIRGKWYYKLVSIWSGLPGQEPQVWYYRIAREGVYRISGKYKDGEEYLDPPFPLTAGATWTVNQPDRRIDYRIEGIEAAELYKQRYERSLKVSFRGTLRSKPIEGFYYRAPGVGAVKQVERTNLQTFETTLEKYRK